MNIRKLAAIFIALVLLTAVFVSFSELQVWNPFAAAIGIVRVGILAENYAQVQQYPNRVVIAQPSLDVLYSTMDTWGYTALPEEQMGSTHVFQNSAGELEHIRVQMNGYFAKWIWQ